MKCLDVKFGEIFNFSLTKKLFFSALRMVDLDANRLRWLCSFLEEIWLFEAFLLIARISRNEITCGRPDGL